MAQKFGRFWLHETIGHGGAAEIVRATIGPTPDEYSFELALKRLQSRFANDTERYDNFLTEADVTKYLEHPNVMGVYEAGFVEDQPYLAMQYVWGLDVSRLLMLLRQRRMRFPSDLAVYTAMLVLRGLDYIHRARSPDGAPMEVVHRDLTPENIYLTFDGNAVIGDFGIASVSFLPPRNDEIVEGKAAYIPPEVMSGAPVSQQDDIWALSICLYEMLTGRPAYDGIPEEDLISGNRPKIEPITTHVPDVDKGLAQIMSDALHPKRKKRPPDSSTLYRQLKNYLRGTGIHVGPEALGRFVRSATGVTGTQSAPVTKPVTDAFGTGGYHSPVGPSFTKRYQIVRRNRRKKFMPVLIVAVALAVAAVIVMMR